MWESQRTPRTAGDLQAVDPAWARDEKSWSGSSEVDPALDRMALGPRHILLTEGERVAGRDQDLLLDQIDSRHHLGHRVFHLDACIDLDEIEVVVGVDQKLTCARVDIADRPGQSDRRLA